MIPIHIPDLVSFSKILMRFLLLTFYFFPDIAKVTHIHLKLDIDFDKKILDGSAILTVGKIDPSANQVILDSRGLNIKSINDEINGQKLDFVLHDEGYVGSKLEINLPTTESSL